MSSLSYRIALLVVPAVLTLGLSSCGGDEGIATACSGMTPLEAARHFEADARRAGASRRFVELVTEPTPAVESSPGYPRLVAAFYATTLPPARRSAAATVCTEELAAK